MSQGMKLDPFELDPLFVECLAEAVHEIYVSIGDGREKHGDAFVEGGLVAFAIHCERKAKDQRRAVVDGVDLDESPNQLSLELATYALLERAYWTMLKKKGMLVEGGRKEEMTRRGDRES